MRNPNVQSIDNRPVYPISKQGVNVGDRERLASGVVGGLLLLAGLKRGSLGGLLVAAFGGDLVRRAVTGHSTAYQLLGVKTAEEETLAPAGAPTGAKTISESVTVGRPIEEVYRMWRDPATFATAMAHFAEVSTTEPDRAHWRVKAPLGRTLAWDAHVVEERPNEFVRWETLPGADVPNESTVTFREAPGGQGTEINFKLRLAAPGGVLGEKALSLAKLVPGSLVHQGMRRFKSLVETGEMPTNKSQGAPNGVMP